MLEPRDSGGGCPLRRMAQRDFFVPRALKKAGASPVGVPSATPPTPGPTPGPTPDLLRDLLQDYPRRPVS